MGWPPGGGSSCRGDYRKRHSRVTLETMYGGLFNVCIYGRIIKIEKETAKKGGAGARLSVTPAEGCTNTTVSSGN